ncbi:MAG: hypothetical protein LIP18_02720 [Planctomycetes bacterium]|nr:hypothetical protein [Planctomycetota bacterium]
MTGKLLEHCFTEFPAGGEKPVHVFLIEAGRQGDFFCKGAGRHVAEIVGVGAENKV